MASRDVFYSGGSGSTATTRAQAHSYTFSSGNQKASTDYLVFFYIESLNNNTTANHQTYFEDTTGAVDLADFSIEDKDATDYTSVSWFTKWTSAGTPVDQTWAIDVESDSGTVTYTNPKILVIEMHADDEYQATDSASSISATSYTTVETLSFTPGSTGDYLIMGACSIESGTNVFNVKLDHSSTAYSEGAIGGKDSEDIPHWVGGMKLSSLSGAQSITLQAFRSAGSGGSNFKQRRIVALRLDTFDNHYYAESRSESSTTSATYVNKLTNSHTPLNKAHVYFAGALGSSKNTSDSVHMRFQKDTTDYGENVREGATAATYWPFLDFYSETPAASTMDLNIDYHQRGGTAYIKDAWTVSLQTEGAAATFMVPDTVMILNI